MVSAQQICHRKVGLNFFKSLGKVIDKVVDMLGPDGEPDCTLVDSLVGQLRLCKLGMSGRGRMDDKGLYVRDIGEQGENLQGVDEPESLLLPSLYVKSEYRQASGREILFVEFMVRMGGDGRMVHPGNLRV